MEVLQVKQGKVFTLPSDAGSDYPVIVGSGLVSVTSGGGNLLRLAGQGGRLPPVGTGFGYRAETGAVLVRMAIAPGFAEYRRLCSEELAAIGRMADVLGCDDAAERLFRLLVEVCTVTDSPTVELSRLALGRLGRVSQTSINRVLPELCLAGKIKYALHCKVIDVLNGLGGPVAHEAA